MPAKKEDPLKATHFLTSHVVGPFARGTTVTAEQLRKHFGKDKDNTPEEHESYLTGSLKRLLDLGAVTPTEPPEDETEAERKADEDAITEDTAAARKAKAEEKHVPPPPQSNPPKK